jgi:hypothetical protein
MNKVKKDKFKLDAQSIISKQYTHKNVNTWAFFEIFIAKMEDCLTHILYIYKKSTSFLH